MVISAADGVSGVPDADSFPGREPGGARFRMRL